MVWSPRQRPHHGFSILCIDNENQCQWFMHQQGTICLRHHVKCKLIKTPQLSMHCNVKEMGHDFTRNREGNIQTFEPMGKIQMSRENPSSYQPPILSFCAQSLEVVGEFIAWEWEEYGKKFKLGRAPIFEKCVLTSWERKNPKMYAHSLLHSRFHLPSRFWELQDIFYHPSFIQYGGMLIIVVHPNL